MKRFQRSLAALLVAGAATTVGFFGFNAVQDAKFAWAAEKVEATRQQLAQVEDLATVFRHVGKVVESSVVSIGVKKTIQTPFRHAPMDDDMLRRFFPDRNGDGQPDVPPGFDGGDEPMTQVGTGSGVIMEVTDGTAYILTNNHVVSGATELEITLSDGRVIKDAKVLGTDPKTDLAVVQLKAERLIAAKWGNSDELQKGDWVMAFGSPFGYVGSMTHGIVSALNRQANILGTMGYEDFIQVDAPINPGNSGGPLVNIRGEVVGINTAILSRTGGFQGVGFAIPSSMAKSVYASLKQNGKVTRGWLGIGIQDVATAGDDAKRLGYTGEKGVLVLQTFPNTPAAGKLNPGDVIVSINGKNVDTVQQLRTTIAAMAPGKDVKLEVFRDGKTRDVTVAVGQQPDEVASVGRGGGRGRIPGNESKAQDAGVTLTDPTDDLAQRFSLPADRKGAIITQVSPRSPAAMSGLRPGDLITRIGDTTITSAADATAALSKADLKKGVPVWATNREGDRLAILKSEK